MKTDENCVKIFDALMVFLRKRSDAVALPSIFEKMHVLIEKSNYGRVEAEASLDMTKFGMHWMEIANDFGNLASSCFHDFGRVALDVKETEDGMIAVVYFQPNSQINTDTEGGDQT